MTTCQRQGCTHTYAVVPRHAAWLAGNRPPDTYAHIRICRECGKTEEQAIGGAWLSVHEVTPR